MAELREDGDFLVNQMNDKDSAGGCRRLLCYAREDQMETVGRLAGAVAAMRRAEVSRLGNGADFMAAWERFRGLEAGASADKLCGVVAGWPETAGAAQEMMASAKQLRVPAYILRQDPGAKVRRIVVATAGGVHAVRVLALADALARAWRLPIASVSVEPAPLSAREFPPRGADAGARSLVTAHDVLADRIGEIVARIHSQAAADDLLLIGAPHFGVAASHFEGSLPERLARMRSGPLLMCLSEVPENPPFREFLWEANICLDVRATTRSGVIGLLARRLCETGVVPARWHDLCLEMALDREELSTTVIGRHHTALPHARLPEYDGVAAALAICPDGVVFDKGYDAAKFVFLLVSSPLSHERYLGMLGRIARQMPDIALRKTLLAAESPAAAMVALGEFARNGREPSAGGTGNL